MLEIIIRMGLRSSLMGVARFRSRMEEQGEQGSRKEEIHNKAVIEIAGNRYMGEIVVLHQRI